MADSGFRLILILQKIPREPRCITTHELFDYLTGEGFETTPRTIQRDMAILSSKFNIVQTAPTGKGKEGVGWAFTKDCANIGLPSMEPPAALTVLMGIEHLRKLLPPQVQQHLQPIEDEARNILANFNKSHYDNWPDKVRVIPSSVLLPPAIDANCLSVIYQALLDNRQFSATYNGKDERVINPYGLVQRDNTFYLLCKFFDYNDIRITALHRFSNAKALNTPIKPDPNFNIDNYINSGEMHWPWGGKKEKLVKLSMYINAWLKGHLSESPLANDQLIVVSEFEGWWLLNATVLDSHQLRFWLLSQGDSLEVIAPKSMREWFVDISENIHGYYHNSD